MKQWRYFSYDQKLFTIFGIIWLLCAIELTCFLLMAQPWNNHYIDNWYDNFSPLQDCITTIVVLPLLALIFTPIFCVQILIWMWKHMFFRVILIIFTIFGVTHALTKVNYDKKLNENRKLRDWLQSK